MKNTSIIIFPIMLLLLSNSSAFAGNPAPYTNEAYKKIESLCKNNPPKESSNLEKEEILRKGVEYWRNIFSEAGYNYDDTIVKVVNDMRNNPGSLPKGPETIFTLIYVGMHLAMSECNYNKVDCLKYYTSDAAESISWLIKNTRFSF